ncbi:MAG: hypothetical protein MUF05_04725 [Candidatus Omnitrophica bacterium]|jgi:hypothetical protein|nr:hypothetical protein [Candidatus Omnitrophota bacterium]
MEKITGNKGMVLIVSLFLAIVIATMAGILYFRAVNESRLSVISDAALQAFYEAEAGLAFAYAAEKKSNFTWFTHADKITKASAVSVPSGVPGAIDNSSGCYVVSGRNFKVKTFPEKKGTVETGIVVVLSQATINGVTRTLEHRIGQKSAYQYFFFFPEDHTFDTATYDGRNFGGLHVNGDINLINHPTFAFLTELSSGSNTSHKGYIRRPLLEAFTALSGNKDYNISASSVQGLPWQLYTNINYRTSNGDIGSGTYTTFKIGDINSPATINIPEYMGGQWSFDKYTKAGSPTTYNITETSLKNAGLREITSSAGDVSLFDNNKSININFGGSPESLTEKEMFKRIYNLPDDQQTSYWSQYWDQWKVNHNSDYSAYHTSGVLTAGDDWKRRLFWATYDWKDYNSDGIPYGINREWWEDLSYGDDYYDYGPNGTSPACVVDHDTGLSLDKYFLNTEEQGTQWKNLLDANNLDEAADNKTLVLDRSQGGKEINAGDIISNYDTSSYSVLEGQARNSGIYMGVKTDQAYKDWQILAVTASMKANSALDKANAKFSECTVKYNQTACSSTSGGSTSAEAVACWSDYSGLYQKYTQAYGEYTQVMQDKPPTVWWEGKNSNLLKDCVSETPFYNAQNPARGSDGKYSPSHILTIDLAKLKSNIDQKGSGFNGIIYIDLDAYQWQENTVDDGTKVSDEKSAIGVMFVNGERLPDQGLSIVTKHNVYVKGDFNLDPDGDSSRNRAADPSNVLNTVANNKGLDVDDFKWRPAEIITYRQVYFLSNDFNLPKTMPLLDTQYGQFYDEYYNKTRADVVTHPLYGAPDTATSASASWMPAYNSSDSSWGKINDWFSLTGITPPASWDVNWLDGNQLNQMDSTPDLLTGVNGKQYPKWDNYSWSDSYVYKLDDGSGGTTYIMRQDLKYQLYSKVLSAYRNQYAYNVSNSPAAYQMVDVVTRPESYIYNTAVITPYAPEGYSLERWNNKNRVINGAFIQLPSGMQLPVPVESYKDTGSGAIRFNQPKKTFNYESRFGKNGDPSDQPHARLLFGMDSTWREINNAAFQ